MDKIEEYEIALELQRKIIDNLWNDKKENKKLKSQRDQLLDALEWCVKSHSSDLEDPRNYINLNVNEYFKDELKLIQSIKGDIDDAK